MKNPITIEMQTPQQKCNKKLKAIGFFKVQVMHCNNITGGLNK